MTESKITTAIPEVLSDEKQRWDTVTSQLNADRPIKKLEGDLLNRGPFCFALANAIREWKGEQSLVIGLYGPWGSGKSSVKDIIVSLLQASDPKLPIIEFNPWFWSGEHRLVSAFFEEIGAALPFIKHGADNKELGKKWKSFAARMTLGGTALGHLKTATEAAAIPWIPLILGTLSASANTAANLAKQASIAHELTDDTPIQTLKEQLSKELKKMETPILVVLDDVDRLTTDEIRLLFRVVKANADFPNLVFFMLYDRTVIEKSLEGHIGSNGRDYMEKIVQAGFDVPLPDQESLDRVLFEGLDVIIGSDPNRMKFSQERWQQVYLDGLRPFFTTLRDVRRFLSSFAFHVGLFFKENQLEVNIVDLIGIEVLRVFEPNLYRELAKHPEIMLGQQSFVFHVQEKATDAHRQRFEEWQKNAAKEHLNAVKELSRCLFPQIDWLLKKYSKGPGFEAGWLRDLRVCHSQVFCRYFSLLVPEVEVSQGFIRNLLAVSHDRTQFRDLLKELGSPDRISSALNRFEAHAEDVEFANAAEVVHALFEIGDLLTSEKAEPFNASAHNYACRIINTILRKEPDVLKRSKVAIKCLDETTAIWVPCQFVAREEHTDGTPLSHDRDVFDEIAIKSATKICARKIRDAAKSAAIIGDRLPFYLFRWKDWSGNDEPKRWVKRYIHSPVNALSFVASMSHEVHVRSGKTSSSYLKVDLKDIKSFVDLNLLKNKLKVYLADVITPEHQETASQYADVINAAKAAFSHLTHENRL
ncbi:MAG: P-loop NTPase fold protein [Pirellulaceae bacterium]|nr:P-loop NTPase fold protein [Pirellulaceae bacterium]